MSAAKKARTDDVERPLVAIAFDIDGVFKYGREWSPKGAAALARVRDARMPYVFVTNGGGQPEAGSCLCCSCLCCSAMAHESAEL